MRNRVDVYSVLIGIMVLCMISATAVLFSAEPVHAVPPARPTLTPSPTPALQPTPAPTSQPVKKQIGAYIKLRAEFPRAWPWYKVHWQELWTIVEWQDGQGQWHNVEDWRGSLDWVEITIHGRVFGEKVWWVDERDFGDGLLRWQVYRSSRELQRLVTSETFNLPQDISEIVTINVLLPTP